MKQFLSRLLEQEAFGWGFSAARFFWCRPNRSPFPCFSALSPNALSRTPFPLRRLLLPL